MFKPSAGNPKLRISHISLPLRIQLIAHVLVTERLVASLADQFPQRHRRVFGWSGSSRRRWILRGMGVGLQEGYRALVHNRLANARESFKSVLSSSLLVSPTSDTEAKEVNEYE